MLDKIKTQFKVLKALNLIASAYSDQVDKSVSCILISGVVHVQFSTITDALDSSEVQWLSPEAYDTLVDLDLIEPA